jgi:hypothetical protein
MRPTAMLGFGTCIIALLAAFVPSYGRPASSDSSQKTVTQLIDDLTQIESESPGISSSAIYVGFAAEDTPASAWVGAPGVARPEVPPQMRELVRRGPLALPELIKHLDDKRPTKLEFGNLPPGHAYSGKAFGCEYVPRVRSEIQNSGEYCRWAQKTFTTYTVRVGDVCYALIGQIVNRPLKAVRNIPSGFLEVNSPIEAPVLIEEVKNDWGDGDAKTLETSLLEDIRVANNLPLLDGRVANDLQSKSTERMYIETVVNPALKRLRLYYPDAYGALAGDDLERKVDFERR